MTKLVGKLAIDGYVVAILRKDGKLDVAEYARDALGKEYIESFTGVDDRVIDVALRFLLSRHGFDVDVPEFELRRIPVRNPTI